jgi:hypothetical protein
VINKSKQSGNPYAPPSPAGDARHQNSRLLVGLTRATLISVLTIAACWGVVIVAKLIDAVIPGEGALANKGISSIWARNIRLSVVLTMLAGFSAFSYYGGAKKINSGVCLLAVFAAGIVGAMLASWLGLGTVRHPKLIHQPIYPPEFLTYFGSYLGMSLLLFFLANRLRES